LTVSGSKVDVDIRIRFFWIVFVMLNPMFIYHRRGRAVN